MAYIFGLIFVVVGLVLLLVSISQRKKAKAAEAWPTVPGVVLSSGLQENHHYDSSDHRTEINYEPVVQYQYSLMGQNYTGTHISFGNMSYDYRTASKKIAPYPQGTPVTVHYDPNNPTNAVLETKAAGGVMLLIMGILFMVIGIVVAVVMASAK